MKTLRIATRKSALALWQAEYVKAELLKLHQSLNVELVPLVSRGDKILDVPLAKVGGKGLFVKELEHALLNNTADIAVHSMKDVPMEFPQGLGLAVICKREDPRDAWVSNKYNDLDELPKGGTIGTSSLRRQSQLLALRPDVKIAFLRGNVNTRLAKLDAGEYDAIVLAAAGLKRLNFDRRIASFIDPEICLPAGGQGAVGIECREQDEATLALIKPLNHMKTAYQVNTERAVNKRLNGGCQVPIGVFAQYCSKDVCANANANEKNNVSHDKNKDECLRLTGLVAEPDGSNIIKEIMTLNVSEGEKVGIALAEKLLARGADAILEKIYS